MIAKKYWERRLELIKKPGEFYRVWCHKRRYIFKFIKGGFSIMPIYNRLSR